MKLSQFPVFLSVVRATFKVKKQAEFIKTGSILGENRQAGFSAPKNLKGVKPLPGPGSHTP